MPSTGKLISQIECLLQLRNQLISYLLRDGDRRKRQYSILAQNLLPVHFLFFLDSRVESTLYEGRTHRIKFLASVNNTGQCTALIYMIALAPMYFNISAGAYVKRFQHHIRCPEYRLQNVELWDTAYSCSSTEHHHVTFRSPCSRRIRSRRSSI